MDMWQRYELSGRDIREYGYVVQKGKLSNLDIEALLEVDIPYFKQGYNDSAVENKMYRKREDHDGRLGDALMVSLDEPDTLPYVSLRNEYLSSVVASFYLHYIYTLAQVTGKEIRTDTKVLLNYQFYKAGASNSLPFHFDAEIFKGDWGKEYIELEEGLIPKLVMVIVLENENDGKGLQIMTKDGEIVDLELEAGDVLFFDNTAVLHGVPNDVPNKRTMMGMRSFEVDPLYFKKGGFLDGTDVIEIDTPYVKGEAIQLSTAEAKEMLIEQGWYYK